ncbi:uncharacterized protein KY384_002831 [Bacidia gigantensis]|uniref:uncharacterized protein n=1 Tax=Bacidia gigantensis TaxID=2732470 RepID=UPI001D0382F6|nr:uncharacterized protein KY384_002831 [Bacidia gigantensis]KAG8532953.1 hypothetical protein KY384_002831 [Bacidia gigantensis]
MSTLLPLFLILTTTLLPSTLAQGANANEAPAVAGTTTSYTLYNHPDTLTVTWGNKPIDPYALYGKTAYDFQLAIPHLAAHETYNASEQGWTDYCSAALPPTTGCVQLHIVPADENGGLKGKIDPGLLTDLREPVYLDVGGDV